MSAAFRGPQLQVCVVCFYQCGRMFIKAKVSHPPMYLTFLPLLPRLTWHRVVTRCLMLSDADQVSSLAVLVGQDNRKYIVSRHCLDK